MLKQTENSNDKRNSIYYNQMLRASERKKKTYTAKSTEKSFASQEVDISQYLPTPNGYEGIGYCLYFLCIPYCVGITFLFFYIAEGVYNNFSLLEITSFLIIWAIGYEITGAIILTVIFFAFLKHLKH